MLQAYWDTRVSASRSPLKVRNWSVFTQSTNHLFSPLAMSDCWLKSLCSEVLQRNVRCVVVFCRTAADGSLFHGSTLHKLVSCFVWTVSNVWLLGKRASLCWQTFKVLVWVDMVCESTVCGYIFGINRFVLFTHSDRSLSYIALFWLYTVPNFGG